jgi:hypothetical protein
MHAVHTQFASDFFWQRQMTDTATNSQLSTGVVAPRVYVAAVGECYTVVIAASHLYDSAASK